MIGKSECLCCCSDGSVKKINVATANITGSFNLPAQTSLQVHVSHLNLFVSIFNNCIMLHEN